jgi:hypothetical protein
VNAVPSRVIELERGLFLIRYAASAARSAPLVMVACEQGFERGVALLSSPGHAAGTLARPGDALVVRTDQRARLSVRVQPSELNGSCEADVSIERLGAANEGNDGARPDQLQRSKERSGLELLAHVARLGDVTVPAGDWIAGPASPARIEGFALRWSDRSRYGDLKYGARVSGRSSTLMWGNGNGSFVGTRGQARPLTEVRFELDGLLAQENEFVIEALFENATPVRAEGRSITLTGPSGREALFGLRVELVNASAHDAASGVTSGNGLSRVSGVSDPSSGRVRVFRSSPQIAR